MKTKRNTYVCPLCKDEEEDLWITWDGESLHIITYLSYLNYFQKPVSNAPSFWFLVNCVQFIKQFVVTNCRKERHGSIVTETVKNGILIPIVTSKEAHFNADFKYISFIKIIYTHQKLRAWENLPHFRK